MTEYAIEIKNLSKYYYIKHKTDKNKLTKEKKIVLDNISIDVKPGEVLGIIGRNGSGKSTLLSIISQIIEPSLGTIKIYGKIATILELGMGFHPDLSGRENIILKSKLYGFSKKEINSKIESIIDYSGLEEYIDNPIRTYSTGMVGRLAFSIMVNVDAEIMIVDEVLSTGDAAFASKAIHHFKKLSKSGKTIIIVSHDLTTIQKICNRAVWIENGKIQFDGTPSEACSKYTYAITESKDIILDMAKLGSPEALYKLAIFYRDGQYFEKNHSLYVEYLKKAAEQGNSQAEIDYADYLLSSNKKEDKTTAITYLESASQKGNQIACLKLSRLLSGNTDILSVLEEYMTEIDQTDSEDLFKIAMYMFNSHDPKLVAKSVTLFEQSSELGNRNATHQLGIMYKDGLGVTKNIEKAIEYLEKSVKMGNTNSVLILADIYEQGIIIERNPSKSFDLYLIAAKDGNWKAIYTVAKKYTEGDGVKKNQNLSKKWFSLSSITNLYSYSEVIIKQLSKITEKEIPSSYYEIVYYSGNVQSLQKLLTLCISGTINSDEVFLNTIDNLTRMANENNLQAILTLGNHYHQKNIPTHDDEKSLYWYEKGAKLGDISCKKRVIDMYLSLFPSEENIAKATTIIIELSHSHLDSIARFIYYYRTKLITDHKALEIILSNLNKMVNSNNVEATRRLAILYLEGDILPKDTDQAYVLLKKAAALGDEWAIQKIDSLSGEK